MERDDLTQAAPFFLAQIPTIILVVFGVVINGRKFDEIEVCLDRLDAAMDRLEATFGRLEARLDRMLAGR